MQPRTKTQLGKHKKPEKIYTFQEADERLYDYLSNHGFGHVTHEQRHQLVKFYQLLMEAQNKENFTRLLNLRDVAIKHFIDCMMVAQITKLQFPLIDIGTGPGFPGIPLKILFPQERILLGEGVQKRVEFLKSVREILKLNKLDIIGRNINEDFHLPVRGAITRAVEDIQNTLRNISSALEVGGKVYLMKGPGVDPEISEAKNLFGEYYKLIEDHAYTLPHTSHERRLVVYEKIKQTPLVKIKDEDMSWKED